MKRKAFERKAFIGIVVFSIIYQLIMSAVAWILELHVKGFPIWPVGLFFALFGIGLLLVYYKLTKDEVKIVGGEK